jgi:hypothetical protein
VRLTLTRRALEDPIHGQSGVCLEPRLLEPVILLGTDELAICREWYDATAHFARLGGKHPLRFDLELLPGVGSADGPIALPAEPPRRVPWWRRWLPA